MSFNNYVSLVHNQYNISETVAETLTKVIQEKRMEEEEKEGLSMCEMVSWFETKGIRLNTEWLSAVLSHLGRRATIKCVFEQFVFSRLEESYERPMKIPDKSAKIVLTKRTVFQVLSVVNVARPIFEQLKDELRTENNLTWFYGEETDDDQVDKVAGTESRGRQCVMLSVTDGSTTLKAIDYGRVEGLTDDLPIGTKLMIVNRVMCRRGVMVLKMNNCTILGGAFEKDENELSKAERLAKMLPTSKKSKIEPYLSRVKKELDLNQRTISPFLRRIPPPDPPPDPPSVTPLSHVRPIENVVASSSLSSSTMHMPPPVVPTRRASRSRVTQTLVPPSAVVEPIVKIEEVDPDLDRSVACIGQGAGPSYTKRLDDSFNTSVVALPRRILPIIPSTAHLDTHQSQVDRLEHKRADIPQRPCVRLTRQTLAERIEASQSRGRNKDVKNSSTHCSTSAVSKDTNRSIASYFQATKGSEQRWNKKTQMVEPSSRFDNDAVRRGIEEGRRKDEAERIMREDREIREREEREMRHKREEEEKRIAYYEQMRRREDNDRRRRADEEHRRNSYGAHNPHVSVVVVSTPTPCSYITPPTGYVTLPQSNGVQLHTVIPHHVTHHSNAHSVPMEMPPPVRQESFDTNFLLFGGEPTVPEPMHLFGSPPTTHPSGNNAAVIPFKKTKIEDHKVQEHTVDGLRMNYTRSEGTHQFGMHFNSDPPNNMPSSHGVQEGIRSGFSTDVRYGQQNMYEGGKPFGNVKSSAISVRPSMEVKRGGNEEGRRGLTPNHADMQTRYLMLQPVSLKEVLANRRYHMMPKNYHVVPLHATIDRNLNIEQGLWDMKMNVVDESGEMFLCQLDNKLLEVLLGMSVDAARRIRETNITQFAKFKDRGCKMFKSMERMDLVLDVEISPLTHELPLITKIRTLAEVLSIL